MKKFRQLQQKYTPKENKTTNNQTKRLLIVFPHNPFLHQNGVQSRFFELLKYFKLKNILIDMLTLTNFVDDWPQQTIDTQELINKVYLNDFKKSKRKAVLQRCTESSSLPDLAFGSLKKQMEKLVEQNKYDSILIAYVHWANLVKDLRGVKKIITIEDFISLNNYERYAGKYNLGASINEEIKRISLFDKAICISREELNFFERVCKNTAFVHVPHFLPSKQKGAHKKETDLVFVGSDNPFNKDGIIWFLEKVVPKLKGRYSIRIIGKVNQHLDYYHRTNHNIEYIDYIDNLDEVYSPSKISICPLQGGTGLKIKVVESLSFGIPVVTTKYGLLDIERHGSGCLEANEAGEFAQRIQEVLENNTLYKQLTVNATQYFKENFSNEIAYKKLGEVFFD